MVLAGAGVYGYGHLTGNDTNGLANVWIDTTTANNTCVYSTTAVAYDDTKACSSFAAAYAFSAAGGTAIVKCGSYDNQAFASGSSHTAMTVFRSENPLCATVQSSSATDTFVFGNGSKYITLQDFTINNGPDGYPISDTSSIGTNINTDHISILDNYINVGVKGNGLLMSLHASQNWLIDGNTFGPTCCGATAGPSLEGIRVGKPNNATPATCANEACGITITNNLFQFLNRASSTWPSSGWGSVPDVSCPLCHNDGIHIFGAQDVQINYNRFYGDECQAIFFESSGNSITSDVDIIGNAISEIVNQCNGGISINFVGQRTRCCWQPLPRERDRQLRATQRQRLRNIYLWHRHGCAECHPDVCVQRLDNLDGLCRDRHCQCGRGLGEFRTSAGRWSGHAHILEFRCDRVCPHRCHRGMPVCGLRW